MSDEALSLSETGSLCTVLSTQLHDEFGDFPGQPDDKFHSRAVENKRQGSEAIVLWGRCHGYRLIFVTVNHPAVSNADWVNPFPPNFMAPPFRFSPLEPR